MFAAGEASGSINYRRFPVIGWERETPVPTHHIFNDYLSARDGRLYFQDLDLAQLFVGGRQDQGLGKTLPSPLEIVYLPKIRQKIEWMRQIFAAVSAEVGYAGRFHYAYASKANAAEEVVRTTLGAGLRNSALFTGLLTRQCSCSEIPSTAVTSL